MKNLYTASSMCTRPLSLYRRPSITCRVSLCWLSCSNTATDPMRDFSISSQMLWCRYTDDIVMEFSVQMFALMYLLDFSRTFRIAHPPTWQTFARPAADMSSTLKETTSWRYSFLEICRGTLGIWNRLLSQVQQLWTAELLSMQDY